MSLYAIGHLLSAGPTVNFHICELSTKGYIFPSFVTDMDGLKKQREFSFFFFCYGKFIHKSVVNS